MSAAMSAAMADIETNFVRAGEESGVSPTVQLFGIGADPHSPMATLHWLDKVEAAGAACGCNAGRSWREGILSP